MKNMYYLIFILLLGVFCCEYDILCIFKLFIKIFILQKYFNNFIDILIGRLFLLDLAGKLKIKLKSKKNRRKNLRSVILNTRVSSPVPADVSCRTAKAGRAGHINRAVNF